MTHCVLSARKRRKQVFISLVNAAPQPIYAGYISELLFWEPGNLKQAHWITLLVLQKPLRDYNNQLINQGQHIGPDRRPQCQTV